jgi:hypothetical protein
VSFRKFYELKGRKRYRNNECRISNPQLRPKDPFGKFDIGYFSVLLFYRARHLNEYFEHPLLHLPGGRQALFSKAGGGFIF